MIKILGAAVLATVTICPASAQTPTNPGVASVNGVDRQAGGYQNAALAAPLVASRWRDTPTTRRQQQAWAIGLRDQALRFQMDDGGVISDRHAHYIQSRAARLLRP